uniref:Uncharacterized protein n=1 Tax=Bradyrhizobium diazoefficiens TaxID=1355477 RepID=A0A810BP79_9BRAD|nr:hypothetical protein XF9B_01570 [Bradyrhizobium diazoefficiens]BCE96137.1 hypothetical protein XF11B_01580 [Bradyrhizobium diazoefficiens]BCF04786.1 hypothetical protein XF12B_01590 [Bradyrhizobium diazoefficiens]BCF57209.1 hypothetical protein XF18B_01570 [Bradyrhizobium diazoefficiens]
MRQRCLQILTLDNVFHRRSCDRRAFETDFRRTRFRLSGAGASGFTLRSGAQVQLDLILLPHGSHEIAALLTTSTVQAFSGALPPTTPSADFCAAVRPSCDGLSLTAQTSRGKTDRLHRTPAEFTTPTFDDLGLRDQLLARPAG